MNDENTIRVISILGGVALLVAAGCAGFNGEVHAVAYALLGFGLGSGFGMYVERKKLDPVEEECPPPPPQ